MPVFFKNSILTHKYSLDDESVYSHYFSLLAMQMCYENGCSDEDTAHYESIINRER